MSPILPCPQLPESSVPLDWSDTKIFESSLVLSLMEVGGVSEYFREGEVRVGWHSGELLVWAKLRDEDIFSCATADNQRMWELGDVFEIFLRDAERENYVELHATPGGHRLQLAFPSGQAILDIGAGRLELDTLMQEPPLFDFLTRVGERGWEVLARVPLASFNPEPVGLCGRTLLASFSRYDYTRGRVKPVLSSTSAHEKGSFHRCSEWRKLHCVPA